MKQIKKIFLIISSLILTFSTENLSAVKTRSAESQSSFQDFSPMTSQYKVSKTSKSSKESILSRSLRDCPVYKFKKNYRKKTCSYISRKNLDENKIYMIITNINHNIDIINEKPSVIGDNEMDKIRIQFNNCLPETKQLILEYIKTKNYYLKSFYSSEENRLLVNLNLPYCEHNIQKIKNTFRRKAPKIFAGKDFQLDVLENVGQIVYDPIIKKFIVSFGNTHGDLLFKISKYLYEKNYKVCCRKESKSMSISADDKVTYDEIKNELNTYIENNPLYVPYADEILKF